MDLATQDAESSQAAAIAKRVVAADPNSRIATLPSTLLGDDQRLKKQEPRSERDMADIDVSSPIRLSKQAKDIIYKLRQMKDEAEDWVK